VRRTAAVVGVALAVAAAAVVVARHVLAPGRGYSTTYGSSVVRYELASALLGRRLDEVAIVPPGGGPRGLLVLLHGRHDSGPLSWLRSERTGPESMLSDSLLRAVADLGTGAPVVVLLNGGAHSYFHDRGDGRWGSMILAEAIPDAMRRFHTVPGRIAIGGISMGDYGALHLASLEPGRFCAAGGHSAALWESPGASASGAFDDSADFAAHDVFAAARAGRYDRLAIWVDGGTNDPFRAADAAFAALLRARGDRVSYHLWPGGHTGAYWHAHTAAYTAFYARALRACGQANEG
jgi:S-formylglutathione hydrolase FrmB